MEKINFNGEWVTPEFMDAREYYLAYYDRIATLIEQGRDAEYLCATNEDFCFYYMMDQEGFDIGEKAIWLAEEEDALSELVWVENGIKNRLREDTQWEANEVRKAYEEMKKMS